MATLVAFHRKYLGKIITISYRLKLLNEKNNSQTKHVLKCRQ